MKGGWVYLLANRYRGDMYVGVTAHLASRVLAHREGRGSLHVRKHAITRLVWAEEALSIEHAIAHEKRVKRWHRDWKLALIEEGSPNWEDLFDRLNG